MCLHLSTDRHDKRWYKTSAILWFNVCTCGLHTMHGLVKLFRFSLEMHGVLSAGYGLVASHSSFTKFAFLLLLLGLIVTKSDKEKWAYVNSPEDVNMSQARDKWFARPNRVYGDECFSHHHYYFVSLQLTESWDESRYSTLIHSMRIEQKVCGYQRHTIHDKTFIYIHTGLSGLIHMDGQHMTQKMNILFSKMYALTWDCLT